VKGKVTFGEKHVAGTVRFVAEDGATGEGVIYSDGTYEVMEAPVGKCKVAIITEHLKDKKGGGGPTMGPGGGVPGMVGAPGARPGAGGGNKPPAGAVAGAPPKGLETPGDAGKVPNGKYIPIPAKYEDPNKSELTFDVQRGEQTFEIPIK